jgi:hypothetical protein
VDTYHGSETHHTSYLQTPNFIEPATGSKDIRRPIWNPREFFLCVLSIRLEQVIGESQALLDMLEDRMNTYVSFGPSEPEADLTITFREKRRCEYLLMIGI